ncbi:MAG TPA: polysaccharide deacetylase family protein [Bacillota bacterium]
MTFLIMILFSVWAIIYPATDFYCRRISRCIIKKGNPSPKLLHLSFDDGPDPRYTPAVLKILDQFGISASFFLVGRKVESHPDLVRQICRAGHEIGSHTYHHHHAYLMGYQKSKATVMQNITLLQSLTGKPLIWFRPPWGALNLFQWLVVKQNHLKPVLWTANANDWLLTTTPEQIQTLLLGKVQSGAIILLHDSGGEEGAPLNTLKALPQIIQNFQSEGYQFVTLQELTGGKNLK